MGSGVLLLGKTEEQNWSNRAIFGFSECGSCLPAAPLALGAAYASCRSCAQLRLPWCYVIKETGARRPPARKTRRKTVRARKRSFRFVICVFWLFHRTRRTCECAREFSRVRGRCVPLMARGGGTLTWERARKGWCALADGKASLGPPRSVQFLL
jgi:hypothetical protein